MLATATMTSIFKTVSTTVVFSVNMFDVTILEWLIHPLSLGGGEANDGCESSEIHINTNVGVNNDDLDSICLHFDHVQSSAITKI